MDLHLRLLFIRIRKAKNLQFLLLCILFMIAIPIYCERSSRMAHFEPQDFTARLEILLYRLKPWCIAQEKSEIYQSTVGDTELESYCACFVGKIDENFRIDRLDLTSDRYRHSHPYVTIQLQSFRHHCSEEIK